MNKKRQEHGKKNEHYVNNKELYNALVEYKKAQAENPDIKIPIPDYIAECLMKICYRLANAWNFSIYYFREDMISDAIIDCIKYINTFDPSKSPSPFCYFTTTASHAFVRRIKAEKIELYAKYKKIDDEISFSESAATIQRYGTAEDEESKSKFMTDFENTLEKNKQKTHEKSLEKKKIKEHSLF